MEQLASMTTGLLVFDNAAQKVKGRGSEFNGDYAVEAVITRRSGGKKVWRDVIFLDADGRRWHASRVATTGDAVRIVEQLDPDAPLPKASLVRGAEGVGRVRVASTVTGGTLPAEALGEPHRFSVTDRQGARTRVMEIRFVTAQLCQIYFDDRLGYNGMTFTFKEALARVRKISEHPSITLVYLGGDASPLGAEPEVEAGEAEAGPPDAAAAEEADAADPS